MAPTDPWIPELEPEADSLTREDLLALVKLVGALASPLPPQDLLNLLLDRTLELAAADRGYVVVVHGVALPPRLDARASEVARHATTPVQEVSVHAARARDGARVVEPEDDVSRTIVRAAVSRGQPVFTEDAASDPRFRDRSSVAGRRVRAVACVPLASGRSVVGALYVERRSRSHGFDERERAVVAAIARYGAVALERSLRSSRIEEDWREARRALELQSGGAFGLVGRSRGMRAVFRLIEKVRGHDANVLVEGETGTGKELVARAIHATSLRSEGPFVVESCTAIPEGLLEAELFGHEKGAFTGAVEARRGAFERADGGTLFLDDAGGMSPRLQGLLLRAIEEGEVRPVGSPASRKVHVRLVAASRQELGALVDAGRFRGDLYFRLNVIRIVVPPLRERKEDVPALVESFLRAAGRLPSSLTPGAVEALLSHDWPGNVRELAHAIERAALLSGGGPIESRHLALGGRHGPDTEVGSPGKVELAGEVLNRRQLALVEYLRANGVATSREYVKLVGVSLPTGWRDLKELIDRDVIRAEGQGRSTVYRLSPKALG